MTLDQFIEQEEKKLGEFKEFWIIGNELCSDQYPINMEEGDWIEQYNMHSQENKT